MEPKETLNNSNQKFKLKNSNNKIGEIKSDYILKMLFNIIHKKRKLAIIKCNKYIQNRLNININTYKNNYEILLR